MASKTTTTETTIDRYNYSNGTGGLQIETVEYQSRFYKAWELKFSVSSLGVIIENSSPLIDIHQIDDYIAVLQNVRNRMVKSEGKKGSRSIVSLQRSIPDYINGYEAKEVYTEIQGNDKNGGKDLLGYNLIDSNGKVVDFVKNTVEGRGCYWGESDGDETDRKLEPYAPSGPHKGVIKDIKGLKKE